MQFSSHSTSSPLPASSAGRWRFLALPVLAVLIALTGCGQPEKAQGGGAPQGSAPQVGYIEVQPQTVDRLNTLPGRVVAYQVAEIRPQVSGIIQSRLFEEGAYVEEGQQLYQIDPSRYEADYEMALANLEDAKARRESAEALAKRVDTLLAEQAVSEQQHVEAISDFNRAKAAISMAEAEVKMAKINLDYTEVRAPISGYISPSTVTKGALVTERQTTPLATVRQLDPVYVDLSQAVAATENLRERLTAARMNDNLPSEFSVRLFPTHSDDPYAHEGTLDVAELAVDPQTGAIRLRSTFPNPDKVLLPGMFVRASVVDASQAKEIVIPQKSVIFEPSGGKSVWVVDSENKAHKRSIQTGTAYEDRWVVLEGLEPGDRLVVEGGMTLREGAEVEAQKIQLEN
ncbi:efflux RND transporter periplasmic adaptor subunit [Puniceicoccus vermicola]|uniref:Efflux RND transporter periplasmic adaptor subunit n=1 Tax=Puniceicoccus vermicola TaxID=388746 RepID=A0A7X1AUD1_9BACT|nr:efflux RND transporter periplasmic adaptor subunit [Puniceicoccus vermicola]MBC2600166.1 efflux RND transporter periplasmic adaptor subunit [Puniceicoccus vermicola]